MCIFAYFFLKKKAKKIYIELFDNLKEKLNKNEFKKKKERKKIK